MDVKVYWISIAAIWNSTAVITLIQDQRNPLRHEISPKEGEHQVWFSIEFSHCTFSKNRSEGLAFTVCSADFEQSCKNFAQKPSHDERSCIRVLKNISFLKF